MCLHQMISGTWLWLWFRNSKCDQCLYRVATEIVLAEYTKEGHAEIQLWLDKDPNAFTGLHTSNMSFRHWKVKQLQPLNSVRNNYAPFWKQLYTVTSHKIRPPKKITKVLSCLCITNKCKTRDHFLKAVSKLARLVKYVWRISTALRNWTWA